jgi:hypothetical protein
MMEQHELEDEIQHAASLIEEEAVRSRSHYAAPRSSSITDDDISSLRRKHAFLADFSDEFIRGTPIGDLMKIESTALKMKEMERSKDADDRLAANKAALATTFSEVSASRDNRWSVLHEGRFLGGAGCSAVRLWLTARDKVGLTGHPPIGSSDMGAVGLAGYVSARGWTELHNMSSTKLSVKLFNINNCSSKTAGKKGKCFSMDNLQNTVF